MSWYITTQQHFNIDPKGFFVTNDGILSHTLFLFGQGSVSSPYPAV